MSISYYHFGEQLMLSEEISLAGAVKLYYSGNPCLSFAQGQLRSEQSTRACFTDCCVVAEREQSWHSDCASGGVASH